MYRLKRSGISLLAAVLALTVFPFTAFATGENVLEPAPDLQLAEEALNNAAAAEGEPSLPAGADDPVTEYTFWEEPYLPMLVYVNRDEDIQDKEWNYTQPGLTLSEYNRVLELMEAVKAGEKTLDNLSYPEPPDELKVGVYPLDPGDFNGETYYVTLPSRRLKDHDLLYLMSCFEKLGIPFDPDGMNSRNCMRGFMNDGTTRKLTREESERMAAFRYQSARGMLTADDVHPEKECKVIRTWFGPLTLYPYRRMTDDELAAFALARDPVWEVDPDQVEKAAREFAYSLFSLPLSMKLTETYRSLIPYTDTAEGYGMTFTIQYTSDPGITGKPCSVYVYLRRRMDNGALVGDTAHVTYYSDIDAYFRRKISGDLGREVLNEIGIDWILDNCLLPDLQSAFRWEYDDDYGFIRVFASNWDWSLFVEMSQDGYVERFSAQRLY